MPIYDAICLLCWHKREQQQNNSRGAWWAAAPISMLHFLQPIFLMPRAAVVGPNEQRTTHNAQHTTRCCPAVTGELFISRKRVVCPWQQQRALTPKCCLKCCAAAKEKTQAWLEGREARGAHGNVATCCRRHHHMVLTECRVMRRLHLLSF